MRHSRSITMNPSKWITIKEAASAWNVSPDTARRYLRTYRVRCRVWSKRMIHINPDEVDRVARAVEARWEWSD